MMSTAVESGDSEALNAASESQINLK